MRLSEKQERAVRFIAENPGVSVEDVLRFAGASMTGSNGPEFIYRLLVNGALRLDVTPLGAEVLAGDDD